MHCFLLLPSCSKRERMEVAVSDLALIAVLYGLRQVRRCMRRYCCRCWCYLLLLPLLLLLPTCCCAPALPPM